MMTFMFNRLLIMITSNPISYEPTSVLSLLCFPAFPYRGFESSFDTTHSTYTNLMTIS